MSLAGSRNPVFQKKPGFFVNQENGGDLVAMMDMVLNADKKHPNADFLFWLIETYAQNAILRAIGLTRAGQERMARENPRVLEVLRTTLRFTPISLRRAGMVHDGDWSSKFERPPIECITAPTLVIHGTTDQIMPIAHGEWVAQTVPGARMVSIEGGHICLFTHSEVTLPALAGFLGEHAPGR